jgi:hypothetical protein
MRFDEDLEQALERLVRVSTLAEEKLVASGERQEDEANARALYVAMGDVRHVKEAAKALLQTYQLLPFARREDGSLRLALPRDEEARRQFLAREGD